MQDTLKAIKGLGHHSVVYIASITSRVIGLSEPGILFFLLFHFSPPPRPPPTSPQSHLMS